MTSKLLAGFDAPSLRVTYPDKPMKDHNLLQAICRTNRTFGQEKQRGRQEAAYTVGSGTPASPNPFLLRMQLSHRPQASPAGEGS